MCGILGFSWEDETLLKKNARLLNHRGPDEEGYYVERVSLGHKRLSIIDLSTGQQPMFNEDGTVAIVFNGEIYNFKQLWKELQGKYTFRTKSDTEAIIHAYEEYGPQCVHKFDGMFAFAIYDKRKDLLFLARDPMGIKPLYYMLNEQGFSFASEMKALPFLRRTIDPVAIEQYLTFDCVPVPRTIFQEAKKLEPGHFLLFDRATGKLEKEKYWDVHAGPFISTNETDIAKEIITRLRASVQDQLVADVPVGVFLSGGIDSSTVTALASQVAGEVKTFSICFADNPAYSEWEFIDLVAKTFNVTNTNYDFTFKDVINCYDDLVKVFDEPFGDSSMFPHYLVSKLAKQHVKVALAGDGGDELFGGYPHYLTYRKWMPLRKIPGTRQVGKILMHLKSPHYYAIGRRLSCRSVNELFFNQLARFNDVERARLLLKPTGTDMYQKQKLSWNPQYPIESVMQVDERNYLHDDLLVKADRASMLASLEVRVPFLQHTFVEFANSIPAALKLTNTTKYILKKAVRGLLPDKIIDRPKKGFSIPIKEWIINELSSMVEDLLLSDKFHARNLFREDYVRQLLKDNKKLDHYDRIWTLMCLEKWFRICYDGQN